MRLRPHSLLVLLLLLMAGCLMRSGFSQESTVTLAATEVKSQIVDAPGMDQKVTVKFTSDTAIDVYVVASKDLPPDIDKLAETLQAGKKPASALASAEKVTDHTLQTTVPAKTEFQVVLYNPSAKSATVKLKIEGK